MIIDIFLVLFISLFINWLVSLHFYLQANIKNTKLRNRLIGICLSVGVLVGVLFKFL